MSPTKIAASYRRNVRYGAEQIYHCTLLVCPSVCAAEDCSVRLQREERDSSCGGNSTLLQAQCRLRHKGTDEREGLGGGDRGKETEGERQRGRETEGEEEGLGESEREGGREGDGSQREGRGRERRRERERLTTIQICLSWPMVGTSAICHFLILSSDII